MKMLTEAEYTALVEASEANTRLISALKSLINRSQVVIANEGCLTHPASREWIINDLRDSTTYAMAILHKLGETT